MDKEKVIKGLECHTEGNCVECPYRDGWHTCPFGETLLTDALNLLKEQEAVVHCKDCKYYRYYGLSEEIVSQCIIDYRENQDGDWFCADGKRREEK